MDNEFISEGYKAGLLAAGQTGHDQPGSCARYTCTHAGLIPHHGGAAAKDALPSGGLVQEGVLGSVSAIDASRGPTKAVKEVIRGKISDKDVAQREMVRRKEAQRDLPRKDVVPDGIATKDAVHRS